MTDTGWQFKPAKFHSLKELLDAVVAKLKDWKPSLRFKSRDREIRHWVQEWNRHTGRHGQVPFVLCHHQADPQKDQPRGEWRLPRKRKQDDGPDAA